MSTVSVMCSMSSLLSLLVVLLWAVSETQGTVQLSEVSTIYLPYTITPFPKYRTFSAANQNLSFDIGGAVEQLAYEENTHMIYIAGQGILHLVDASDPHNMTRVKSFEMDHLDLTDIELCGDVFFLTLTNLTDHNIGTLQVYKLYNPAVGELELLHEVEVGSLPDMVYPREDCQSVVIAQEAEGYKDSSGQFHDPEGAVVIVKFPLGPTGDAAPVVTRLDFRKFNDKISDYYSSGVRFVTKNFNNNSFSHDVEPEYVALDHVGKKAYICLQENNAIAEVDLVTETITEIYGLGYKQWGHFDPSDKDDGIRITYWPVRALYLPDSIHFHRWQGRRLVFTANEGDNKEYDGFHEKTRGRKLQSSDISDKIPGIVREAMSNDKRLGRLYFSNIDGRDENGIFQNLYTYGGRGFSIWDADKQMQQVYDSGSSVEETTSVHCRHVFNEDGITYDIDFRSDDQGPETESIMLAEHGDRLYIYMGNERPGTISVYSMGKDMAVRFETIFCGGIPDDKLTMQQKFAARELFAVDPEDIKYVSETVSPISSPMLVVAGTVSGTVSMLKVDITDESTEGPKGLVG